MKVIGITLGWDMKPHLCFEDGKILYGDADKILYPQYFENGDYPTDPTTKEELPIVDDINVITEKARKFDELQSWFWWLERRKNWTGLGHIKTFFKGIKEYFEPYKEEDE